MRDYSLCLIVVYILFVSLVSVGDVAANCVAGASSSLLALGYFA